MGGRAHLPCVLAFGVLLPLVAVSFATWFVFYDRAIRVAQDSGKLSLLRTSGEVALRVQEQLLKTDDIALQARNVVASFLPWTMEANETLFDKPQFWMHWNMLRTHTPKYVYALVCTTASGMFFATYQRTNDSWGYIFQERGLLSNASRVRFYVNVSDISSNVAKSFAYFGPATTWNELKRRPDVVFDVARVNFRYQDGLAYQDALQSYRNRNVSRGWTPPYPIRGGAYDNSLGLVAWFGLQTNPGAPFLGMCHSQLYLGDVHRLLASADLGPSGMAVLTNISGHIIATSRPQDSDGGVGVPGRASVHVCDEAGLSIACKIIKWYQRRGHSNNAQPRDDYADLRLTLSASEYPSALADEMLRSVKTRVVSGYTHVVYHLTARAFTGYLVLIGKHSDFDNNISHDRAVAIGASAAVLAMAIFSVAFFVYLFSRPLQLMTATLRRISHAADRHTEQLAGRHFLQSMPTLEWTEITDRLHQDVQQQSNLNDAAPNETRPVSQSTCDRVLLGRWGGPEVKQLQSSLVAMVSSLSALARSATEQEQMRRQFIRYIFHEVVLEPA